jgi:WhiB family transcriptional regulator, redox-sensing transcriptional regulator
MSLYTVSHYLRDFGLEPAQAAEDLTWQDAALCAETDPEAFFPEKGGSTLPAKQVCRNCEVRAECLDYALKHEDISGFGIWGGLSERQRRRLKRDRVAPSSRFRGVTWDKRAGKWAARVRIDGHRVHVGHFTDETAAGRAVLEAEGASPELAASLIPQPQRTAA